MTSQIRIKDKQFTLSISEEEISSAIRQTALQMEPELKDLRPLFICVLNGAFMFASDLLKQLNFPCEITFVRFKSYEGTNTDGHVREIQGLVESVAGRHVVILEDIVDTGHTIARLKERIAVLRPASLRVATLLFKPDAVVENVRPDYVAIRIPNDFIVGYGLDYDGWGRNLRNIYQLREG
jgi:hypoxanthine phosphoribosyltransferase